MSGPKLAHRRARVAAWRLRTFGPASEEPYRRRVTDWVQLVLAIWVLAVLTAHSRHPSAIEVDLFRFVNDLPSQLSSTFRVLSAAGTLWAVALAVAAAVISRRRRLARDLLLAGLAGWAIAHTIAALVAGSSISHSLRAVIHLRGTGPQFPLARVAVVVAVTSTATPYITRPTRRAGYVFIALAAVSALYMGTGLPNDVLGGVFLGLAVAAAVHLVFGSPGGRPTSTQVTAALSELGIDAPDLRLAETQPRESTLMVGNDQQGPIRVRVIGRDEADAQLLAKLWRVAVYKGSGPTLYLSRLQEVEHSAYITVVARDHGVRTPEVVLAGQAGPKAAVLVERQVPGQPLADISPSEVSQECLVEIWRQVGLLRAAHIRHGALDTAHVVIGPDGPVFTGFGAASALSPTGLEQDVISLLVSTAAIVGPERALSALICGLGEDVLTSALPLLQPAALSRRLRSLVGHRRDQRAILEGLRTTGADAAGVPAPRLLQMHRVSGANLSLAVGTFVGIFALLGQASNLTLLWQTIERANLTWLTLAFALSIATNLPYAVALKGAVPRKLPLWPTAELQLSMSFANLAVPAIGGVAEQVRFLQKRGVDLASAIAAGGLVSTVANGAVNLGVFALALAFSQRSFHLAAIPVGGLTPVLLVAVAVAGVGAAAVLGVPRLRLAVLPPVRQASSTIWAVVRSPRQLFLLVGGFVGVAVLYAFCLQACLQAFGATLSPWTLLALSVGTQSVAALVPVPGGGTAISAVGMSGVLAGFGLPPATAVAAALSNQLIVNYLPALPGWLATRNLINKDEL